MALNDHASIRNATLSEWPLRMMLEIEKIRKMHSHDAPELKRLLHCQKSPLLPHDLPAP
jgi:hypothetical protein